MTYQSWGQYPKTTQQVTHLYWRTDTFPQVESALPYGQGRSYGDVNLNDGGTIVSTQYLNHIISFDSESGIISCESGVTLGDILRLIVPHGWFIPVSPGTKFVSVGGAIANDVHGKNHHRAGTFGSHVLEMELLRSDNSRLVCTPTANTDFFAATIGGLGLTGIITRATIQLKKIDNPYLDVETLKMHSLDDFWQTSLESDTTHEYTVGWVDTSVRGGKLGRGLFMRGNWATKTTKDVTDTYRNPKITMPVNAPDWMINIPVIKAFNFAYYHKQFSNRSHMQQHYDPFFYPLDIVQYWNRLYGKRGFQSYQCVVPKEAGLEVIRVMLDTIHRAGLASPLTVFKLFGNKPSPGMMSFPAPGINLLLDFPNVGEKLNALLHKLDNITADAGGKVNPAKDAHLSPEHFAKFYPQWKQFSQYIDPRMSSSFWRRVTKNL